MEVLHGGRAMRPPRQKVLQIHAGSVDPEILPYFQRPCKKILQAIISAKTVLFSLQGSDALPRLG